MESNEKIKWAIDKSHSEVGFKVKHLMVANVRGIFLKIMALKSLPLVWILKLLR